MPMTPSDLNTLLGSRICHDLISPLGAIGNGVELLQMSGMGDSPEMTLISESVENANARIRLFRVAFGAASPGQDISAAEIREAITPIARAKRIEVEWSPEGAMPRSEARLIFLLFLCAETMLPWGGTFTATGGENDVAVRIAGERMRLEDRYFDLMTDADAPRPEASEVHFVLARLAAEGLDRTLVAQRDGGGAVTVTAS